MARAWRQLQAFCGHAQLPGPQHARAILARRRQHLPRRARATRSLPGTATAAAGTAGFAVSGAG